MNASTIPDEGLVDALNQIRKEIVVRGIWVGHGALYEKVHRPLEAEGFAVYRIPHDDVCMNCGRIAHDWNACLADGHGTLVFNAIIVFRPI